jgi:hypothetical protein
MNNPAKIPALPAANKKCSVSFSLRTGAESLNSMGEESPWSENMEILIS